MVAISRMMVRAMNYSVVHLYKQDADLRKEEIGSTWIEMAPAAPVNECEHAELGHEKSVDLQMQHKKVVPLP
jgi:hypothetical protein